MVKKCIILQILLTVLMVTLSRILYQLLLQEVNTNWYAISSLDISNELSLFSFLLVPTIFNSVAKGWFDGFRSFWSANIHFLLAKTSANIVLELKNSSWYILSFKSKMTFAYNNIKQFFIDFHAYCTSKYESSQDFITHHYWYICPSN